MPCPEGNEWSSFWNAATDMLPFELLQGSQAATMFSRLSDPFFDRGFTWSAVAERADIGSRQYLQRHF
jgi:hypothetical protein